MKKKELISKFEEVSVKDTPNETIRVNATAYGCRIRQWELLEGTDRTAILFLDTEDVIKMLPILHSIANRTEKGKQIVKELLR